jgi:hypothetical protein
LLASGAALVIGLSSAAVAQTRSRRKPLPWGKARRFTFIPRAFTNQCQVTSAQHEAAMKKGAHEIKPGTDHHQNSKLYMLEDSANSVANLQSNFDVDY